VITIATLTMVAMSPLNAWRGESRPSRAGDAPLPLDVVAAYDEARLCA